MKKIYVGTIAAYIAARMQHPNPRCNGRNPRISTIHISQHKEKFGMMRIYCTLADKDLVLEKWQENGHAGDPDVAFMQACFLHDAKHYRKCHLDMVNIVPSHRNAICSQADYSELLYDDVAALDKRLDEIIADASNNSANYMLSHYEVVDADALRTLFHQVYEQSSFFGTEDSF